MSKKKLFLLLGSICLMLVLVACAAPAPAPAPTPSPQPAPTPAPKPEPIVLGANGFLPKTHSDVQDMVKSYFDKIGELSKGELIIEWRGGPEVFATGDIGNAVRDGATDIGFIFFGAYEPIVPGVNAAILSEMTLEEELAPGGAWEYMRQLHEQNGLFWFGRTDFTGPASFYWCYLHKKVEKQSDFAKLILGSATAGRPAILGWGAAQQMFAPTDFFSAMERNVVDGIAGMPMSSWYDFGIHEVTDYVIDQPFYNGAGSMILNLAKFNSLPEHLQKLLADYYVESEPARVQRRIELESESKKKVMESGVEFYKLSPEVAEWYLKAAYTKGWEFQMEKFPDVAPELKKRLTKGLYTD